MALPQSPKMLSSSWRIVAALGAVGTAGYAVYKWIYTRFLSVKFEVVFPQPDFIHVTSVGADRHYQLRQRASAHYGNSSLRRRRCGPLFSRFHILENVSGVLSHSELDEVAGRK